ncbi:MAG: MerR family transcriptional regulator [Paludibacteraceae bacterium]|nr:MerR family transcriptional regulator [Paludibacteraceae bacterium]
MEQQDEHKVYFSINEVSEQIGVPASTLRYWEKQFDGIRPRKDGHGNRYYRQSDIDLIKQIKYLRDEMHITRIEAIRNELSNPRRRTDQRQHAYEILTRVKAELEAIRAAL